MLHIKNLHAKVKSGPDILKGFELNIKPGEVHAIMGPNGAGKSTLSSILAGRDDYEVTGGSVNFAAKDLLTLSPEDRAAAGLFLAFQYPIEIPGVNNLVFMKMALNSIHKKNGLPELDAYDFMALVKTKLNVLGMDESFLKRGLNEGFSGGEKKRNEVLQMLVLDPKLIILDETDSGLDIDALQDVARGVNSLRDNKRSFIVVTHYQRLLDFIVPDFVHVMIDGKIVKSGPKELAHELEAKGYEWLMADKA